MKNRIFGFAILTALGLAFVAVPVEAQFRVGGIELRGTITISDVGILQWGSSGIATPDLFMTRIGAASVQFGLNSATPVAQKFAVANARGGTDTNVAGVALSPKITASLGTGTAIPGTGTLQGGALGTASGTTSHTAVDRFIWNASKVLTNNTVTALVNVTDASNTVSANLITYSVEVFNGTDLQVEEGSVVCHVINKAGAFSANTCLKSGTFQNAVTSGTLAVTWTITAANPALLQVNANSSLTPSAGYPRITYTLTNFTQQAVAVQ